MASVLSQTFPQTYWGGVTFHSDICEWNWKDTIRVAWYKFRPLQTDQSGLPENIVIISTKTNQSRGFKFHSFNMEKLTANYRTLLHDHPEPILYLEVYL